ncbi:hypothetical protein OH77DRAFT_1421352 [Trametes cingulata]|nr:hypothetical protein OH77DRAFT_1421352 [Trametes cingulata]
MCSRPPPHAAAVRTLVMPCPSAASLYFNRIFLDQARSTQILLFPAPVPGTAPDRRLLIHSCVRVTAYGGRASLLFATA